MTPQEQMRRARIEVQEGGHELSKFSWHPKGQYWLARCKYCEFQVTIWKTAQKPGGLLEARVGGFPHATDADLQKASKTVEVVRAAFQRYFPQGESA